MLVTALKVMGTELACMLELRTILRMLAAAVSQRSCICNYLAVNPYCTTAAAAAHVQC
jgi:hypothetical protein